MKKIISFEKSIDFPSMVGEITSISLDHTLGFTSQSSIEGDLIVSGTYKMTEASAIEEDFKYNLPAEIVLTEKLELDNSTVSIDDFHYEIVNDDTLKCNIDILVSGKEVIEELNEEELVRECDGDMKDDIDILDVETDKDEIKEETLEKEELKEDIEIPNEEINEIDDVQQSIEIDNSNISSLFESLSTAEETFTTYSVYIYRKEDSLDKILDKYKITREDLIEYNDLDNIEIGSKLIIPNTSNE